MTAAVAEAAEAVEQAKAAVAGSPPGKKLHQAKLLLQQREEELARQSSDAKTVLTLANKYINSAHLKVPFSSFKALMRGVIPPPITEFAQGIIAPVKICTTIM